MKVTPVVHLLLKPCHANQIQYVYLPFRYEEKNPMLQCFFFKPLTHVTVTVLSNAEELKW